MAVTLTIRMADSDYEKLREVASERQIPISTMARSFLVQALRSPNRAQAKKVLDAIESDKRLAYQFRRIMVITSSDRQ